MKPNRLDIQRLTKTYPTPHGQLSVLTNITFHCEAGEWLGIKGPSGSGKSTLLHLLGAVEPPSSGKLIFNGQEINSLSRSAAEKFRRQYIGFVFQYFHLLRHLTAVENVMIPLLLLGARSREAKRTAHEVLDMVGLAERYDSLPFTLSGGEQQRVALARAVVHRSAIILADEPTGNLDEERGVQILQLLKSFQDSGTIIVMASHSDLALKFCSKVLTLRQGTLIE